MDLKLLAYYHHGSSAVEIIKLTAPFLHILLSTISDCISVGLVETVSLLKVSAKMKYYPPRLDFTTEAVQDRSLDTGWLLERRQCPTIKSETSSPDS